MAEKKGFDLASLLGNVPSGALVSELDTGAGGREQIEYLELALLDPDPRNFYSLDGIDGLAASIQLLGLQQPLRVRRSEADPARYTVVSGHRRREALRQLAAEDPEKWRLVPCLLEEGGSQALQELRLICANSDTRRMTSAEISRQAERVQALLYELKEQGMEFPGRMRDYVAEACQVSRTKLARLKVIREKLAPELKKAWEHNDLSEATAYALAQQPEAMQLDILANWHQDLKELTEITVSSRAEEIERLNARICGHGMAAGGPCINREKVLDKKYGGRTYWACECYNCCGNCPSRFSCSSACSLLAEKLAEEKAQREEQSAQAQARDEERKRQWAQEQAGLLSRLETVWSRFFSLAEKAGAAPRNILATAGCNDYGAKALENIRSGGYNFDVYDGLPFSDSANIHDILSAQRLADVLHCSLDYLLGRTDVPEVNTGAAAPDRWQTGTPEKGGLYVGKFDYGSGVVFTTVCCYSTGAGAWLFQKGSASINEPCVGWVKLPEEDEELGMSNEE